MISEESEEFLKYRRDLEDRAAHEANPSPWKRRWVPLPTGRVDEVDPRDRD